MFRPFSRRSFLATSAAGGAALGLGDLGFLGQLPAVSAAEATPDPKIVQLRPEIEPLVRLLEDSPRGKVLEAVADKIHAGASYRDVLAALLLAGVRNVQPRPSVGFKFHAVLVVNSAHLASISSPDEHRWLPIFWAIDEFKASQARDVQENNWTMTPVDEAAVPRSDKARAMLIEALETWDEAKADAAIAGFARTHGANDVFEILFRYGPRDFRSIGHKAIYAANAYRTLNCIGWQHAEPVLRSLVYAMLMHDGQNPAKSEHAADLPGRRNAELAREFKPDWASGQADDGAVQTLLATLRTGSDEDACRQGIEIINGGAAAQSVWDAIFLAAGEYLMRQPGIVALHAVTTTNALRFAYETAADDETRRYILLQNLAFLPLFRQAMGGRGKVGDADILALQPHAPEAAGQDAIGEIFRDVSGNQTVAASKLLAYLGQTHDAQPVIDAARILIFLKGTNAHDYKFSSAVLEDYYHVSPAWRNRFLASSVFQLRGAGSNDNPLVARTRAALA
jgi:hypothetical protein